MDVCAASVVGAEGSKLLDYLPMVADLISPNATSAEIEDWGDHFLEDLRDGQLKDRYEGIPNREISKTYMPLSEPDRRAACDPRYHG